MPRNSKYKKLTRESSGHWIWTREFEAFLEVGQDDHETHFELYVDKVDEIATKNLRDLPRSLISKVIEMDTAARSIRSDIDYNEELAAITIHQADIYFRYWATTVNTEWDVVFQFKNEKEWTCLGIPIPNKPGKYFTKRP